MKKWVLYLAFFGVFCITSGSAQSENKLPEETVQKLLALQHLKRGTAMKLNFSTSGGITQIFEVKEVTEILPLKLKQKYPRIKSYYGFDGDNMLSLTVAGNRVFGNAIIADELIEFKSLVSGKTF